MIVYMLLGIGLLTSCSTPKEFKPPDEFKPIEMEERFQRPFKLRIDKLKQILHKVHKMNEPVPIILIRKGQTTEFDWEGEVPEDAEVVGYLVEEHNKIVAKIEQGKMMAEISELLVQRVQVEVELYNAMLDVVKLQDITIQRYRTLWVNAENRVIQLEYKLEKQRIENKVTLGVIGTIAVAIAIAIAL